jgi:SAM-dependent methyltransferase
MLLEAQNLSGFYASARGAAAAWAIGRQIERLWPSVSALRVLGVGFPQPYLEAMRPEAERVAVLMPAAMGAVAWPQFRPLTVLGEEAALPFADAFFDRILLVHGLEGADNVRVLLRQLWRVLTPEGRMLIVAPNRVSLWALSEVSPFACGRPFRRGELAALLRDTLFEPLSWQRALYMPPAARPRHKPAFWERVGGRFFPGLAGVHIVEVKKTLYGVMPLRAGKPVTVFAGA